MYSRFPGIARTTRTAFAFSGALAFTDATSKV
jgi:hypothetical protein